jgi:hypothetical protein
MLVGRMIKWVMGAVCVSILGLQPAQAGMLELVDVASGRDGGWIATWDDGDDIVLSVSRIIDDTIYLEKFVTFTDPPVNQIIPPATIVFEQVSADALPYIAIADDIVINNTGFGWIAFRFVVEPVQGGQPRFDRERTALGQPEGFAIDPFSGFEYLDGDQVLEVSDGLIPPEPIGANIWFAGVGPGALYIQASPGTGEQLSQIVLHQIPIIPLPPAGWAGLFTLGGLAAVGMFRRLRHLV